MQCGAFKKAAAAAFCREADEGKRLPPKVRQLLETGAVLHNIKVGETAFRVAVCRARRCLRQQSAELKLLLKRRTAVIGGVVLPVNEVTDADGGDPAQKFRLYPVFRQQAALRALRQSIAHLLKSPACAGTYIGCPCAQRHHLIGSRKGAQRTADLQRGQHGRYKILPVQLLVGVDIPVEILQIGRVQGKRQSVQVQHIRSISCHDLRTQPVVGVVRIVVHHDLAVSMECLKLRGQCIQLLRAEGGCNTERALRRIISAAAAAQQSTQQHQDAYEVLLHDVTPFARSAAAVSVTDSTVSVSASYCSSPQWRRSSVPSYV